MSASASDREHALREAVVATAREMNVLGINRGKSGNVSARLAHDGFSRYLITPTGLPYAETRAEDIVAMPMAGDESAAAGTRLPSSEWRFHRDIYAARPEIAAIVHTHAPFATTLACLDRGIPPFHYMIAMAGGFDIRCAPYATFGTQALSDAALRALEGRMACLLGQHGQIALGKTPEKAFWLATEVETLARLYVQALPLGEPPVLDDAEMARVIAQMERMSYGMGPEPDGSADAARPRQGAQ